MNEAAVIILTVIGATVMGGVTISAVVFGLWLAFRKPTVYTVSATPVAWNNLPW